MQPHITYSTCTWLQLNGPKLDLDTQRWRKGPLLRIHSPWLSNKHRIQGLLSLLLFLKYFSSPQISFLWPGGCSGHSRWRWWIHCFRWNTIDIYDSYRLPKDQVLQSKRHHRICFGPEGEIYHWDYWATPARDRFKPPILWAARHIPGNPPRAAAAAAAARPLLIYCSLRVTLGATSREHCDTGRRRRQSWVHADTWIKV